MESSKSLLFAERPYVICLTHFIDVEERKYCWSCCKKTKGFRCATCKIAAYCSKECQRRDWMTKQHKYECEVFAKASNKLRGFLFKDLRTSAELRFVGRVVARKRNDSGIQPEEDRIKFPESAVARSLIDVPTALNVDNFVAFPRPRFNINDFLHLFKDSYAALSHFYAQTTVSDILHAYSLLRSVVTIEQLNATTNTTNVEHDGISDVDIPGLCELGVALFPQMTRFRYSCDPDVVRIQENGISYFKLIKPDKEGLDLESLTTNFDLYCGNHVKILTAFCRKQLFGVFPKGKDSPLSLMEAQCSFCISTLSKYNFDLQEECSSCNQSLVFQLESNSVKCSRCNVTIPFNRKKMRSLNQAVDVLKNERWIKYTSSSSKARYRFITESAKLLHPVRNHPVIIFLLGLVRKIVRFDLRSVVFPGSFIHGSSGAVCKCHFDSEGKLNVCMEHFEEADHNLERRVLAVEVYLLCNSLDPEKSEIKKFGDRLRRRENLEWIFPLMEIFLRGMDYYGFQLGFFIQLRQDISEIYARAGLKNEALEIAARARQTLAMCYYESHPRVKDLDAHLKKLTEMK